MDVKVKYINAYSKDCIGCKNNNAEMMIAITPEGGSEIIDYFLTKEQVDSLQDQMHRIRNSE